MNNDNDTESPASLIRQAWSLFPVWVNVIVIAFILIAGIIISGQRLGFWLDTQNIQHQQQVQKQQNSLVQNAPNVQQGYVQAVSTDVTAMDGLIVQAPGAPNRAALLAQAVNIGNQACLQASYLTGSIGVSAEMQKWIDSNCSGGTLTVPATRAILAGKDN